MYGGEYLREGGGFMRGVEMRNSDTKTNAGVLL